MSTISHTAGPWKFSFESFDPEWAIVTTASGSIVANVNADHRQEANARLISAAPDLLEVLKLSRGNVASLNAAHPAIWGEWLKVIDAAISKAEGVK